MLLHLGASAALLSRVGMNPGACLAVEVREAAGVVGHGTSKRGSRDLTAAAAAVTAALNAAPGGEGGVVAQDSTPRMTLRERALRAFLVTMSLSFPDEFEAPETLKSMLHGMLEAQVCVLVLLPVCVVHARAFCRCRCGACVRNLRMCDSRRAFFFLSFVHVNV